MKPAHPWMYPGQPWERVHAGFCEYGGKQYLAMVDAFSKWPEVHKPGSHATTTQVLDVMRRHFKLSWIASSPSDRQQTAFTASEFQLFTQRNGNKHQRNPPYDSASNRQAEKLVQELKRA